MTVVDSTQASWADAETLRVVRPEVRKILEASDGFGRLTDEEKRKLASTMVRVASYMADPSGVASAVLAPRPAAPPLARAQADATEATRQRLSQAPGFAGQDFQAGALRQGTEQFGELVKKVDFPKFVSGLIQNVFQAIVDASIQQMRAYGELLANVAKTVDQFAQDNITENNARDWLAQKYPDKLGIDASGGDTGFADGTPTPPATPRLTVTGDDAEGTLKAISDDLHVTPPITDISDEAQEKRLVLQARLQIARTRQQLLASMVILGINRIVVTDGLIHAKVVFDLKASDIARRAARASMYDRAEQKFEADAHVGYSSWFSPVSASMNTTYSNDHMATVESSVDETSESKAALKANLTGEVRVNFKSDYFPMEKLATPQMIGAIQGNAAPANPPAPHSASGSAAPAAGSAAPVAPGAPPAR